ncbi:coxsackievirus and adenovirus receptor homolog [Lethenteron reissneri]|uniref:coxsackievirus and adenovirus receptor homolog n=1 Tax=Lethenteron reissneri TaxID=7753 RepID=UPI002AB7EFE7|nr:coxsackievirus and adenovirus receptor homolog [Lethenteron reissneri]
MNASLLLLLSACLIGTSLALTITSTGGEVIQKLQGASVSLACAFSVTAQDVGVLDIEWIFVPSDKKPGIMFATYTGSRTYTDTSPAHRGRVRFTLADPSTGDASVELSQLGTHDTGTFLCKVKQMPGTASRTIALTVMAVPSATRCSIKSGSPAVGEDLVLGCVSTEGTAPITYTWTYTGGIGGSMPSTAKQEMEVGTLALKNATLAYAGTYRCTATNTVGTDSCEQQLHIAQHKETNVGSLVAAIVCPILLIALAIAVVVCCVRRRNLKRKEKELSHVIRMDESPPPPSSRSQSRSSRPLTSQAGSSRPLTSHAGSSRPLSSQGGVASRAGGGPPSLFGGGKTPSQLQPTFVSPPPQYDTVPQPSSSSASSMVSSLRAAPLDSALHVGAGTTPAGGVPVYATVTHQPQRGGGGGGAPPPGSQRPFVRLDEEVEPDDEEEVDEEDMAMIIADGMDPLDHHHPPKQRGYLV